MMKQFVPQEVCLKCRGCCRFSKEDSVWLPCLLEEEIQDLLDRKGLPSLAISADKKIQPVPHPAGEGFSCPCLDLTENKCCIYSFRPFECQLYPFLLSLRGKKILLTLDLNCPYVKEKLESRELKEYIEYLNGFLNQPSQIRTLKDNPHLLQAYEDVLEVMELRRDGKLS